MCFRTCLARIAVIGSILGSVQHIFYRSLDNRYPARDAFTIAKKILIDQTVCSPLNIAVFIYGLGFLEHKTLTEINEEFKDKCAMIFLVSCSLTMVSLLSLYSIRTAGLCVDTVDRNLSSLRRRYTQTHVLSSSNKLSTAKTVWHGTTYVIHI